MRINRPFWPYNRLEWEREDGTTRRTYRTNCVRGFANLGGKDAASLYTVLYVTVLVGLL